MRLILFLFLVFSFPVFAHTTSDVIDTVVAVVNDEVITKSQVDEQIENFKKSMPPGTQLPAESILRKQIINDEIDKTLQLQMAKQATIQVSDAEVNQAITEIAKRNGLTVLQLKEKIAEQGINYDRYFQEIHNQMVIRKLQQQELVPLIQVSPQEIQDYLQHEPVSIVQPQRYHIIDYLVPLSEQATAQEEKQAHARMQALVISLQAGKPPSNEVQVNDLGWRKKEELPTLFQPVVGTLSLNGLSAPLRAGNGFHILKLVEVENAKLPVLQEVHLRKILLKEDALNDANRIKARLVQIRADIAAGGNFEKMAKSISQDPQSRMEGGDLGWLPPGALEPEVDSVVESLKKGEVSRPIKTSQGWVIVQVVDRRPIQNKNLLREAKAREAIFNKKVGEKLKTWLQKMRVESYIKVEEGA